MIEQLKTAIRSYKGPMIGNSIEAVWFRGAVRQLLDLQAQEDAIHRQASTAR